MRIQHRWQHNRCAVRVLRPYRYAAAAVAAAASSWPKSHVCITHQQPFRHDGSNAVRRLRGRASMLPPAQTLGILRFRIAVRMDRGYSHWVDQSPSCGRVHARPCRRPLPQLQPDTGRFVQLFNSAYGGDCVTLSLDGREVARTYNAQSAGGSRLHQQQPLSIADTCGRCLWTLRADASPGCQDHRRRPPRRTPTSSAAASPRPPVASGVCGRGPWRWEPAQSMAASVG